MSGIIIGSTGNLSCKYCCSIMAFSFNYMCIYIIHRYSVMREIDHTLLYNNGALSIISLSSIDSTSFISYNYEITLNKIIMQYQHF